MGYRDDEAPLGIAVLPSDISIGALCVEQVSSGLPPQSARFRPQMPEFGHGQRRRLSAVQSATRNIGGSKEQTQHMRRLVL
jgi:hypothetical protein